MILFKDPMMQREYGQLDIRLKYIIPVMEGIAWNKYGDDLVVTSIFRQDNSTHHSPKPYRFIDFAILEHGGMEGSELIRSAINILFPYDTLRPQLETIVPLNHGNAPHMHVQVKPLSKGDSDANIQV